MGWLRTRGRAILAFLADLGGALTFVALAAGLGAAAISGAVLAAWTTFPQPYFTLLVVGIAFLAIGMALHFLREPLSPPPPKEHPAPQVRNPYSDAAALQRRHDEKAEAEAQREAAANLRRATRRIREELLDNKHVTQRIPTNKDELLALSFDSWRSEKAALLDQDDPKPYELASAAYREVSSLLRGRVEDDGFSGGSYVSGAPSTRELDMTEAAIDAAVTALATEF